MQVKLVIIISVVLMLVGWIGLSTWIGYRVHAVCITATKHYSGSCTEALIKVVNEESFDFRFRNEAVWALGQLGDRQALSTLQRYYTGVVPPKEKYDQTLSQYELRKAIDQVEHDRNVTALWWRSNNQ